MTLKSQASDFKTIAVFVLLRPFKYVFKFLILSK